jgi:hypothetical protein
VQLDAAGYKQLITEIQSACAAGKLSPPTMCRLGFHSVHIAASVGKGWGANGGFHAFAVDYDHQSNAGMGDDIKCLLEVGSGVGVGPSVLLTQQHHQECHTPPYLTKASPEVVPEQSTRI